MACGLASEDLLAVCLVLADGDLSMDTADLFGRILAFQSENGSFFGVSEADLILAITWLGLELGWWHPTGAVDPARALRGVHLRDWTAPVLDRGGVWFNDEGETWLSREPDDPVEAARAMRAFLSADPEPTPAAVQAWLAERGRDRAWVQGYLEAGRTRSWQ